MLKRKKASQTDRTTSCICIRCIKTNYFGVFYFYCHGKHLGLREHTSEELALQCSKRQMLSIQVILGFVFGCVNERANESNSVIITSHALRARMINVQQDQPLSRMQTLLSVVFWMQNIASKTSNHNKHHNSMAHFPWLIKQCSELRTPALECTELTPHDLKYVVKFELYFVIPDCCCASGAAEV